MKNFNRGSRFNDRGGKRNFDNRGDNRNFSRGRNNSGRQMMHQAICSECGNNCQIPFKPTGDRPVFCSTCFEKQGGASRANKFGGDRGEKRSHFEDRNAGKTNQDSKEILKGIKTLNYKLDELIKTLSPKTPDNTPKISQGKEKTKKAKVIKAKVIKKSVGKKTAKKATKKKKK